MSFRVGGVLNGVVLIILMVFWNLENRENHKKSESNSTSTAIVILPILGENTNCLLCWVLVSIYRKNRKEDDSYVRRGVLSLAYWRNGKKIEPYHVLT